MKFLLTLVFQLILTICLLAQTNPNHVWVSGYYRSNGTYVKGYHRTAPNHTNTDNFSTRGNFNPYTGKSGWVKPDGKENPWLKEITKKEEITYEIEPTSYSRNSTNSAPSTVSNSDKSYASPTNSAKSWYSKGDQVNVRYLPESNGKIAFRINKGDEIEIISKSPHKKYVSGYGEDYWYEIRYNNVSGWVFGKLIGTNNYDTTSIEEWDGDFRVITGNNVNVRTDPSTKIGKVKFQLSKDQNVEVLAKTTTTYNVNGYG